jgi:succinate dehydrogenase / fumarate reductase, membrane anchor subunit
MTSEIQEFHNTKIIESYSWKYMRLSAFLLIPLVWFHSIIQALIVGGQNLSVEYVQMRWAFLGWRIYDLFLLIFAFTHGISGLRQVFFDFIKSDRNRRLTDWLLFALWLIIIAIGSIAIIGNVRLPG